MHFPFPLQIEVSAIGKWKPQVSQIAVNMVLFTGCVLGFAWFVHCWFIESQRIVQLRDSGLTQASLYDNAESRRFLIEPRNVIVLHNFHIKANAAAVSPWRGYSALCSCRQATIRSETFLRCCALICFLNLTEPITARAWCIYFQALRK